MVSRSCCTVSNQVNQTGGVGALAKRSIGNVSTRKLWALKIWKTSWLDTGKNGPARRVRTDKWESKWLAN
jgi:hypothetical protein